MKPETNNSINKIVFEVYENVLNMNYNRNDRGSIFNKAKKLFRYILSGYIWSIKNSKIKMSEMNSFLPTSNIYKDIKIAIYTVSTGNYDSIREPIFIDSQIDYYAVTESELSSDSIWNKILPPDNIKHLSSLEKARYVKTHPHLLFGEYDYSIFIDGNIRITCDIKPLVYTMIKNNKTIAIHNHQVRDCIYDEGKAIYAAGKAKMRDINKQLSKYRNDGFPNHFGLFETNIIIRKHTDKKCIQLMEDWWFQIEKYTKRDQLSFTYALWKNNLVSNYVLSLGNNSRRNPYFIVDTHN